MDCVDSEVNQTKDPGQPLDVLKGEYRFIGRLLGKNGLGIGDLLLHLLAVKGKIEPWRTTTFQFGSASPPKTGHIFPQIAKDILRSFQGFT